jgi:hypothetical protein
MAAMLPVPGLEQYSRSPTMRQAAHSSGASKQNFHSTLWREQSLLIHYGIRVIGRTIGWLGWECGSVFSFSNSMD